MTRSTRVFAGLVGALAMSVFFILGRLFFGLPTPSELFPDRIAPFIPVDLFGQLIGLVRGYTPLKIIGFTSVVIGQLIVGMIGGLLFATRWKHRLTPLVTFVAVLWILAIAGFWPILLTNYHGVPAGGAAPLTAIVLLLGFAIYGVVTAACLRSLSDNADHSARPQRGRGAFIVGAAAVVSAVGFVVAGRRLTSISTLDYDGTQYKGPDVVALTPTDRFYVVTKNVADPSVARDLWRLDVRGAVARPRTYDFAEFTALPSVEQETTLMCISNDVDGGLMSNAQWTGVPLRMLLATAGVQAGVVRAVFHATDNYIDTIPIAKAMESTTLVAYRMNGEPLADRHGFPARMIVPGLFGEKHVKWLTGIELATTEIKGFYERQGWGPKFSVPTHARFDAPNLDRPLRSGSTVELRGVAFAGDRGVMRVEISTDGGTSWHDATLTSRYSPLIWRLWRFNWRPDRPGTYNLLVRATDSRGTVQTAASRPTSPEGATGLHRVIAHVA